LLFISGTCWNKNESVDTTKAARSKIGRAELGGDPESVSNVELYVRLKPKSQWTTARTKDELVDAMRSSAAARNDEPALEAEA
jgi:cobalt-zinc-cadmium resistance protein CzcA